MKVNRQSEEIVGRAVYTSFLLIVFFSLSFYFSERVTCVLYVRTWFSARVCVCIRVHVVECGNAALKRRTEKCTGDPCTRGAVLPRGAAFRWVTNHARSVCPSSII